MIIKNLLTKMLSLLVVSAFTVGFVACDSKAEDKVEDVGESIEDTAEDAADKVEDAGEELAD